VLTVAVSAGVAAGAGPSQSPVVVQAVTLPISGCPAGSVAQNIAPDNQAFTLLFDSFVVEVGPGVAASEGSKDCRIDTTLKAPEGKSVAVVSLDYRGFVSLEAGVSAKLTVNFDSPEDENKNKNSRNRDEDEEGPQLVTALAKRFVGPLSQDYHLATRIPAKEVNWSTCDGTGHLRIHVTLAVHGAGQGLMTLDSLDGEVVQGGPGKLKFKVHLRPCP
jgi:hypothetical protein